MTPNEDPMAVYSRRDFLAKAGAGAALLSLKNESSSGRPHQGRKIRVALVGLGYYAEYKLAPGLKESKYCELAGIVTGTPAKAETWKKQYNIPDKNIYNYQTYDQIADNEDIDADSLLSSLREGNNYANEERRNRGWPTHPTGC